MTLSRRIFPVRSGSQPALSPLPPLLVSHLVRKNSLLCSPLPPLLVHKNSLLRPPTSLLLLSHLEPPLFHAIPRVPTLLILFEIGNGNFDSAGGTIATASFVSDGQGGWINVCVSDLC